MESTPLQWVRAVAEEYEKTLTAGNFNNFVVARHEDGGIFFFNYAFSLRYLEQEFGEWWVIVFTEHHGIHIYAESELIDGFVWEFARPDRRERIIERDVEGNLKIREATDKDYSGD